MFNPEYAQPFGGSMTNTQYNLERMKSAGSQAEAEDAHDEHVSKHSTALNHHLIDPKASLKRNHPSAVAKLETTHKGLLAAVDSAPKAHADMDLFSGISKRHADILSRHKEGEVITSKAWTSASHKPEVAARFAGTDNGFSTGRESGIRRTVLHVAVRRGQGGLLHLGTTSMYGNEGETLIKPGTKFRINKIHDDPTKERRIISVSME